MDIGLVILLYFVIGAIVEFLIVFSVLMYAKRHSNSDEQFIEAWNKANDLIMIPSLFNTKNINRDVSFAFQLHMSAYVLIWPIHVIVNILVIICTYVFYWIDHFFYKLTSFLVKR